MSPTLKEVIFRFQMNDRSVLSGLDKLLVEEIIEAVKGRESCRSEYPFVRIFSLKYHQIGGDIKERIPDDVEWNGISVPFWDAAQLLLQELRKKIEDKHFETFVALTGDELDRKKWIQTTLGQYVLANKLFSKKSLQEMIKEVPISEFIQGDSDFERDLSDLEQAREFAHSEYAELCEDRVDVFQWQKEAWFWVLGKTVRKQELETHVIPLHISFFYTWLRCCSHASQKEVAGEADVDPGRVSRWLNDPDARLTAPYPDPKLIAKERIFFPVFFSEKSRVEIGMYAQTVRCSGECHGEAYKHIISIKETLWAVYNGLRGYNIGYFNENPEDSLDVFFADAPLKFSYSVRSNHELNLHPKKRYFLIFLEVTEG